MTDEATSSPDAVASEPMDEPTMTRMTVETVQGPVEVTGRLLGQASSENPRHSHRSRMPRAGERCSACRWMVITILRDGEEYVVVNQGKSRVPGEIERGRVERTTSPIWVLECLMRPDRKDPTVRYIPTVSRKALSEAAVADRALADEMHTRVA